MDGPLDTAPCGLLTLADDGTVLAANATLLALMGRPRGDVEGHRVETLLTPGARIFYQTHVFPLLRLHAAAEEVYLAFRGADGGEIPVLLNAVRRPGADGVTVNECAVVPMRRRYRLEQELVQARRAAQEADHAKARLLSMLSHDLRTPLGAISMAAHIHARGRLGPVTELQARSLARVEEASRYVLALLGDMLTFARLEAGRVQFRVERVELDAAIARAEPLVALQAEEAGLTLDRAGCGAGVTALADPDRLQQVLLNLLTNALKFTPRGGRVAVACEAAGDRVRLHVADTGRGIAADELERVFAPFVQLEPGEFGAETPGAGLGLAISRQLVRAMGGELSATSTPGEGSTFTVELPAAGPAADVEP